jgi:hypothetical protein
MKLIGLTGHAGSGKDYVYGLLDRFYEGAVRVALADEVRIEVACEVLSAIGATPRDFPRYLGVWQKPYTEAQRRVLQWWGTEFRRSADPNYWVDLASERILEYPDDVLVVVTDVRFANEAEMIHRLGGIVVQVACQDDTRAERLGGVLPPAHASENIDFEVDTVIWNETKTVVPLALASYLGMPLSCTKCRTLYRDHSWHDDGTPNENHGLDLSNPARHVNG